MKRRESFLEESISDAWVGDMDIREVPLNEKPLFYVGIAVALAGIIVFGRILFLNVFAGEFYAERSEINLGKYERVTPPRGLIVDRFGKVIAENRLVFAAMLDVKEFIRREDLQKETIKIIANNFGMTEGEVWEIVKKRNLEKNPEPITLVSELEQEQVVTLKGLGIPTILIKETYSRDYLDGPVFSSVVGYVGLATSEDLEETPGLSGQDFIGKMGLELFYDEKLRGEPGVRVKLRDAEGNILSEQEKSPPKIGDTLNITIDADLQKYFYGRMRNALAALNRKGGVGLAMNPQNGEILALVNFPVYDNNVFVKSGKNEERKEILNDPDKPLFNRTVGGLYSPGSTIKPLVAVAALSEGVISPEKRIFSPGYLDVPNPYDPENPTRFEDWRYQGSMDLAAAIAQSSNVYFYTVGGGAYDIDGLGLDRLKKWWENFGLGELTGIDLPGEATGFLPTKEWKEDVFGRKWLLGDTYNVSIGQGDLLTTPLALLNYISGIASDGIIYKTHLMKDSPKYVLEDLREFLPEIQLVQKGMRRTVTSSLGTAHMLDDLPFEAAGKTGSAQIRNNKKENAFFVGYAPYENPQIAILVMVEQAREGSLNAIPIANDVLDWYYEHRLKVGTSQ